MHSIKACVNLFNQVLFSCSSRYASENTISLLMVGNFEMKGAGMFLAIQHWDCPLVHIVSLQCSINSETNPSNGRSHTDECHWTKVEKNTFYILPAFFTIQGLSRANISWVEYLSSCRLLPQASSEVFMPKPFCL